MTAKISKKVCLLGDFSVGKTSLIRRFVERKFSENYLSTVGVTISKKTVEFLHNSQDTYFDPITNLGFSWKYQI